MAVPQVMDTNLNDHQANALKEELDDLMLVDIPHNPFIDINRGSCYNQSASVLDAKLVAKTNVSWEDFLPAVQFSYNTSSQSSLASSPFELLYGYKPALPKSTQEAKSVPVTFAQEHLHVFKFAK